MAVFFCEFQSRNVTVCQRPKVKFPISPNMIKISGLNNVARPTKQ